jgi:hypothetical protein
LVARRNSMGLLTTAGRPDSARLFELAPPAAPGGNWSEILLHSFTGAPDGDTPNAGVIIGQNGALYGTAEYGGEGTTQFCQSKGCGVVFQLTPPAEKTGPWTETILHTFTGLYGNPPDGSQPNSALVPGPNGVFYGTTLVGGSTSTGSQGNGTIFEMVPPSLPGGT